MLLDLENFTFQANFGLFTVIKLANKYLIQEFTFRCNIANLIKKHVKLENRSPYIFHFTKVFNDENEKLLLQQQ